MTIADKLVLQRQHHLKWRWFDKLELMLMMLSLQHQFVGDGHSQTLRHPRVKLSRRPGEPRDP